MGNLLDRIVSQSVFKEDAEDKKPGKHYSWDQCISDMTTKYGSAEMAKKVCGTIRAQSSLQPLTKRKKKAANELYEDELAVDANDTRPGDIYLPADYDLEAHLEQVEGELNLTPIEPLSKEDYISIKQSSGKLLTPMTTCPYCGESVEKHSVGTTKSKSMCKTAKFQRCVGHVEDQGMPVGSAYAICYDSIGGAKTKELDDSDIVGNVMANLGMYFNPDTFGLKPDMSLKHKTGNPIHDTNQQAHTSNSTAAPKVDGVDMEPETPAQKIAKEKKARKRKMTIKEFEDFLK